MAGKRSHQPVKGIRTPNPKEKPGRQSRSGVTIPAPPLRTRKTRSSALNGSSSHESSKMDLEDGDLPLHELSGRSRKVLKAVAVPKLSSEHLSRRSFPVTSSSSSSVSNYHDTMTEYDTPATSMAPTPAESTSQRKVKGRFSTNQGKEVADSSLSGLRKASFGSKSRRKRPYADEDESQDVDLDEAIALTMQQEEYEEDADSDVPRTRSRRRLDFTAHDTEDLTGSLIVSDYDKYVSDLVRSRGTAKQTSKRRKIHAGRSMPSQEPLPVNRSSRLVVATPDLSEAGLSEGGLSGDEDQQSSFEDSALSELSSSDEQSLEDNYAAINPVPSSSTRRGQRSAALRASRSNGARPRVGGARLSAPERERAKLEKAHPEVVTLWDDLKAIPILEAQRAVQPKYITRQLKGFQLEGLSWMRRQEESKWKGGLLGDEMGMGKTIQAVSLIMSDYPAKHPTLVVVPPVALIQWSSEIAQYTEGRLKVFMCHNTNPLVKKLTVNELKKYDVIMISYSSLESIYRKESKGWKRDDGLVKANSCIHALHYHRLILDEAHNIKSKETGVATACYALKGNFKWCLSGTPVQNRIGEFFSLLRFLEVKPFACYLCKSCSCSQLHSSRDDKGRCKHCGHTVFQHVSLFNHELLKPITQSGCEELRREGLTKLRLLTDRIMLRRMKRDHTASMELPPKEIIIRQQFFGEIEQDFSSSIMKNTTRQFDTYVSRGVMLNNYANIFGLIMQMRQVANHPDLILKKSAEGGANVLVCCICDETAEEPVRSRCYHEFCRRCVKDYLKSFQYSNGDPDCPRCHIKLSIDLDQPDIEQDQETVKKNSIINRIKMEDWTSSTKIEMLIYELYKLRSSKQTHKSIVFSQFTSMLQLVEWRLRRAGFNTVMLDGSMTPAQRQNSIDYFMNKVDVEVFLVSLKAGGVALNLTEASRVFIVDPWWNPAAEWQSADRCHRIGQKRPCVITRLCIEDSVESRMVMLQEKKSNMIAGCVNGDDVAMEKLTPEDMQFLFRGN